MKEKHSHWIGAHGLSCENYATLYQPVLFSFPLLFHFVTAEPGPFLNLNKLIVCICFPAVRFKSHHRHQLCCWGCQDPCRESPPDARAERERGATPDTEGGGGEVSLVETFVILLLPLNTDSPVTFFFSLYIWQRCCCWCLFSWKLWFLFSETTSYVFFVFFF